MWFSLYLCSCKLGRRKIASCVVHWANNNNSNNNSTPIGDKLSNNISTLTSAKSKERYKNERSTEWRPHEQLDGQEGLANGGKFTVLTFFFLVDTNFWVNKMYFLLSNMTEQCFEYIFKGLKNSQKFSSLPIYGRRKKKGIEIFTFRHYLIYTYLST